MCQCKFSKIFYCPMIPSFLNLASISSMWMPIFSGSLSRPAQMTRRPSGVKMRPCSLSVWYCWYFSYSLFDICFMMTSKNKYSRVRTRLHLKARTSLFYQKTSPRHYAAASRIKDVVQFSILWSSLIKRGSLTTENGSMGALALLYSFGWSGPK